MKVIVFGKSQRRTTRKVRQIVRAFREQGNETIWLNPAKIARSDGSKADQYMLEKISSFKPDIIFIHSQDIPLPVLQQVCGRGITTVMFYMDWRPKILQSVIDRATLVDIFLVTGKSQLEDFRRVGVRNPIYFIDACDRHEHRKRHPFLPIWKSDLAFIGQARPNELRVSLVQKLSRLCHVRVYGRNWEQVGMKQTLKVLGPRGYSLVCSGAKIILGSDIINTENGYWSNRLWITLGCGGFLLTNYVPGMEDFFINHEHLVWYHSEDECISLVREYLANPLERRKIADQGYRLVHENHTFHHFVDKVLAICEAHRNEKAL
jgi:spore maturation protein CgeB